ncbi:hypothetical protein L484_015345 [Morus notabilis]|uniref:Uncharacterized protein n=1 Tax=Morus notabilis TaxID=981085 RepID=W9RK89_9ROSA|nr:hypothetical protein L484_015345 [Morus notabilis]
MVMMMINDDHHHHELMISGQYSCRDGCLILSLISEAVAVVVVHMQTLNAINVFCFAAPSLFSF